MNGNWDTRISRRTLLRTGGAAAVVLYGSAIPSASAGPSFADYPFKLGVASGEPAPNGAVLWTRLAPDPLNGGGLGDASYRVRFEVATDPSFLNIVHRGHTRVGPEEVHTVHAEVTGLKAAREYWYRFKCKNDESPVGRFRTAPRYGTVPERLKFAYVSCQNYTHGYFSAFNDLWGHDDVELVVHLGDYIYEGPGQPDGVRAHAPAATVMTLDEYRTRHAQYKTDPSLQEAHAAFAWLMTWDDHEFANNYADLDLDPDQPLETAAQRRAAAYLAYWEHSPLPRSRKPVGQDMPVYRRAAWGDMALFHVLDTRQHRNDQVSCTVAQRLPNGYCPEAINPARTILGEEQRNWLIEGLTGSTARWNVLANQVRFAPLDQDANVARRGFGNDNWDGYVADRQRVLDAIKEHKPNNPIVITGDAHVHSVRNVPPDFENFDAPPVATEFMGASITSTDSAWPEITTTFGGDPQNPHRLFQTNQRGYVLVEVTPESWTSEHLIVDAMQEYAPASTIATFAVEDGKAGAIRVNA